MEFVSNIYQALFTAFSMFWAVLWPLILGFTLSAIVQAVVSNKAIAKLLGDDSPKCLSLATLFGAASSSCSYAAIALARSLFRKGAHFSSAMAFELASTNLVIELGIVLIVLMGWQFAAAEFVGGILMVILIAMVFRLTLTRKLIREAREQVNREVLGKMEGHAKMDMSLSGGSLLSRLVSIKGFDAVSNYFIMDWVSVWVDIVLGFLIAGALAVFVPADFWKTLFLINNPTLAKIVGPLIGPLIAIFSFVCSVGNIPLAAVLWQGGISFGGVISFIFADLIVLPILDIYRRYYGWKVMLYLLITFYITMVTAGYLTQLIFEALHLIPETHTIDAISSGIQWNYTSVLNIIFLSIGLVLTHRFISKGGLSMLKMMDR